MGVKGLWRLIEEAGTPVPLESLENKVLAVDVSIWLHQAVRGFRGIGGETVANAHLLTLFHRICKLLYFGIKPVFVFDGGVPHLKKQTQSLRRVRREAAANRADRIRERLLNNLLKSHAVRHALGRTGPAPSQHKVVPAPKTRQKDMFELPPLPEGQSFGDEALKNKVEEISSDENGEYSEKPRKRGKAFHYKNLHNFDLDSEQFRSLPIQKQHEILVELQDSRKDNSWATINSMPSESSVFATYQMDRLLKRFKFQTTIDSVRSAIQQKKSEELERELFGDLEKHVSQTHKIASEDFAHSIFITKERDTTKDEEPVKPRKVDKGKSLMKKPQKDFLQELMKEGIFKNPNKCSSYCDTDDSSDEEFSDDKYSDSQETRDEALVQVMNYALSDNNGLTQDEILRLIQQSKQEADTMIESDDSKPSTSRNASGVVCNADVDASDSDDTDDFVEVDEPETDISGDLGAGIETAIGKASALEEICPVSHNSESDGDGNNIDALRSSNSSSLYIKIVQHRLDDIIQVEDKSLGKAKVDTRRKNSVSGMSPGSLDEKQKSSIQNSLALSIDVSKPKLFEEDIFADIFSPSSSNTEPNKESNNTPAPSLLDETKRTRVKFVQNHRKKLMANDKSNSVQEIVAMEQNSSETKVSTVRVKNGSYTEENIKKKIDDLVKVQLENMLKTSGFPSSINESVSGALQSSTNSENCQSLVASAAPFPINLSLHERSEKTQNRNESDDAGKNNSIPSMSQFNHSIESPEAIAENSGVDSYDDDDFIEVHEPISESRSLSSEETRDPTSTPIKRSGASSVDANDAAPTGNLKNGENLSRKIFTTITKISGVSTTAASSSTSEAVDKTVQNASAPAYVVKSADECNFDTDTSAVNAEVGFAGPNEDDLKKIEQELAKEQKSLVAQAQKGDRIASNLSQQMYTDAQELLQLFGLPYIVAPMEAEAQCAFLDDVKLTNGTITDDSDAFLFGSKHVYKNFFNQSQHVELYKLDNIRTQFGLDREKLITLALLTGSDYTMGIEGVGAVSGMEILSEFPGTGIEILRNFKKWWISVNRGVSVSKPSKLREKLYKVYLPEGFPNDEVYTAYIEPAVDQSREKFEWSVPNTDALREFTADKLGWSRSKTDEILIPVMKRLSVKSSQTRIDTFFNNVRLVKDTKVTSKRLQEAIARSRGDIIQTSPQPKDNLMAKIARDQKASKKPRKRRLASENVSDVSEKATDGMTPRSRIAKKPRVKPINNVPSSTNAARNANNSSVSPSPSISEKQRLSTQEKKEEIFNHLLKKKEEITQRKAAEAEMLRKKQQAAIVLRSEILKGKKD